jgi:hypothetical protein
MNVHRCDEPVATDTVYSDTTAVDSGAAQLFVGTETLLTDVYGMKTYKEAIRQHPRRQHPRTWSHVQAHQ